MELEKSKLACIDTLDIIDYIKQSVEILMHMRMDEFELFKNNWNAQEKMRKAQVAHEKEKLKEVKRMYWAEYARKKAEKRSAKPPNRAEADRIGRGSNLIEPVRCAACAKGLVAQGYAGNQQMKQGYTVSKPTASLHGH